MYYRNLANVSLHFRQTLSVCRAVSAWYNCQAFQHCGNFFAQLAIIIHLRTSASCIPSGTIRNPAPFLCISLFGNPSLKIVSLRYPGRIFPGHKNAITNDPPETTDRQKCHWQNHRQKNRQKNCRFCRNRQK